MAQRDKPVAFTLATPSVKRRSARSGRIGSTLPRSGLLVDTPTDPVVGPRIRAASGSVRRPREATKSDAPGEAGANAAADAVAALAPDLTKFSQQLAQQISVQLRHQLSAQIMAQLGDMAALDFVRTDAFDRIRELYSAKLTSGLPDIQRLIAAAVGTQASLVAFHAVHDLDLTADTQDHPDSHDSPKARGFDGGSQEAVVTATSGVYAELVLAVLRDTLTDRFSDLSTAGMTLPPPQDMAGLLTAALPATTAELDPHFADLGPFFTSDGASKQLGSITKQAVDSRRRTGSILAMQTQDGTWLYPAWQFAGDGTIHDLLTPVLRALRGMNRWQAGVWLVSEHPDLDGRSPRQALRDGTDPRQVAAMAAADRATSAA